MCVNRKSQRLGLYLLTLQAGTVTAMQSAMSGLR
jgi:hypothetical protein